MLNAHCCLLTKEDSVAKKLPFANICWYCGPAGGERLARIKSVWEVLRLCRDGEVGLIFLDQLYTRGAQCIDKQILIRKNSDIDIDIEIDKRTYE